MNRAVQASIVKRRLLACATLALGALASACSSKAPAAWTQESGYRWRPLDVAGGTPGFTPMRGRSGIRFQNTVSESLLVGNRVLAQGGGVSLGDVDGDGRVDVFLARTQGCSALFRNLGDWRFEDITQRARVGACERHSTGSAFADVDADGDLDLVLLATKGPNAIFVNDGRAVFTERRDLGLDTTGRGGTTVTMADVDGDARLDLFVANYKPFNIDDSIPPQQRAFNQMVRQTGPDRYEIVPEHRNDYKLVLRPDMGGLRMTTRAEPDDFYRNEGGRFARIPFSAGLFRDPQGQPETDEPESFSLMAKFADLNGDGAPDLYVANDFEDADELWLNEGRGTFRRADWTAQRQISNSSMGVDVADVSGDGLPDLFAVDMLSNDPRRLKTQIPTHTALPKAPGAIEVQLQQQRNTMFINRGDGTFGEVGLFAGIQASGWSWSTMFLDADLDGWQDILITSGHLWDIMDADTHERLQNRLTDVHWQRVRWEFPKLPLKNVAYRNRGDLTFEDVSAKWGFDGEPAVSHALAAGDLDGDGDLDVVVNRLGSPALILRNNAAAPRIAVRLVGAAPNTRAVGAKIRLLGGAVPTQEREVSVGGLYMSHSDYQASFAMGEADSATLIVDWRDGRRSVLAVRPNREYEVSASTASAAVALSAPTNSVALFEDASAELAGHTHSDPQFDDWERQFLLPNSLSQLGPGVAWFDLDRDGDEDLVIGAGKGGRLGVFRNDRGRLVPQKQSPVAQSDFASVLGLADASSAKLLIGVASWESPSKSALGSPSAISASWSAGAVSSTTVPLLPALESSVGAMALGDYDGDGDVDLFVGGRAVPAQYPRAASSYLFRNEGGRFAPDSGQRTLDSLGLVSAASFADIDGDGDADLIIAREWDSLLVLLNDKGHFAAAPSSWGLDRWTSRWNGVATGDVDGDGRLDLVATSWGRNTMMQADSARPLTMFYGPIGQAGEEELLIAREDPQLRALVPLNSYPRVRAAIPGVADRIRSFAEYSAATIETVMGAGMSKTRRKSIVTLDHMLFLNRGGRFESVPLPRDAQLAPAFAVGVADFDGDGDEDVFLGQNFSATAIGIPRYDGGRGLLLMGDGKGTLVPMAGALSGIKVYGDQRGAAYADFNGDGRLDLAVSQNGAPTRLFRNRAARPGLRVRLHGPASNPGAVGAQLRVVYGGRMGPVREIQVGSGYWSQNGALQVFGLDATPTAVWVRWPGGPESRTPVPNGAKEVEVRASLP